MKKILYLSLFLFSFILLGIHSVSASELNLSSLGYSSCLDSNDNLTFDCSLNGTTTGVPYNASNFYVSNYFLVSDTFTLVQSGNTHINQFYTISFYDKDYNYLGNKSVNFSESFSVDITKLEGSFYARMTLSKYRITVITDDYNSISSLNYAINSLTETVGNVFSDFTWVFLLAFSIVVIGFIIALILRVGK